ncbi:hypothetical protein I3760_01G199500 [Carya illinoinensis]|nr:hypothetical protein I3760_01G199500 [Carya illinoinensis]
MALQHTIRLPLSYLFSPFKENKFRSPNSATGVSHHKRCNRNVSSSKMEGFSLSSNSRKFPMLGRTMKTSILPAFRSVGKLKSNYGRNEREASSDSDEEGDPPSKKVNDPYLMDAGERREWRRKIREVIDKNPDVDEVDAAERRTKMQKLLADYPLVVEEDDPDWPEDADGWGFSLGQFFDKITIKNNKKDNDDNQDSDDEIVWQDDNYIRPIKDMTTLEWEEAVFKDISPLIILVHNRYKRPKENEKIREELEKAVHIIWNCRLPSPRCVAVDAVVEVELVSALEVSVFPEIIFTKAGKILYREKAIRTADELSKIMAFFYYGAAKPPCLNGIGDSQEAVPSVSINSQVC